MSKAKTPCEPRELSESPRTFVLAWGLPILLLLSANFLPYPGSVIGITAAFVWMGTSCLINARRCRRRHCFISGPVFLLGAAASALTGFGVIGPGPQGLAYAVWGTVALVILSFVPEFIWGKYLR